MPAKPTCQPWCEEHKDDYDDSCNMTRCLYKHDKAPPPLTGNAELDGMAAAIRSMGVGSGSVDTVLLEVTKSEEDEQPLVTLEFWDSTKDLDWPVLETTISGMKDLHAELGRALAVLEKK